MPDTAMVPTQQDLIPSTDMPAALFDSHEQAGQYTAARLFAQQPETVQRIQGLLAEGVGILRISRIVRVSPSTVIAVRDLSLTEIEKQAHAVGKGAMSIAHQSIDAIQEAIDDPERRRKTSPRDWAIIAGVMVDKAQLLAGLPTSINLNVAAELPSHDEYERRVSEMGKGGEDGGQKGGAADGLGAGSAAGPGAGGPAGGPGRLAGVDPRGAAGAAQVVDLEERGGVFEAGQKGGDHE
jgi:hypothetical protein